MNELQRFPHTPHLAWLGPGKPRDDKVLSPAEVAELLSGDVVVEEKIDGANLGLSIGDDGALRAQNRGKYLTLEHASGQWKTLPRWLAPRIDALSDALFPDLILFGEWCVAVHSVHYTRLPDWFVAFDVFDRRRGEFWSVERRDALASRLGIALVPRLARGHFDLRKLQGMLGDSRYADGPAEGIYVRREDGQELVGRAKLVRPEFVQAIDEHWSRRPLRTNALAPSREGQG